MSSVIFYRLNKCDQDWIEEQLIYSPWRSFSCGFRGAVQSCCAVLQAVWSICHVQTKFTEKDWIKLLSKRTPCVHPLGSFEPHTWRWQALTGMGPNLFRSKTPKCKKMQNFGLDTNQLSLFDCWYCTKLFVKVEILTASKLLISVYKLQYESDFRLLKSQNSPHWKENIRIVYVVSIFQLSVLLNHSGAQIQIFILDQKPKQISRTPDSKLCANRTPKVFMSWSPSQSPFWLLNSLYIIQLWFEHKTQYNCMEAGKFVLEQNINYRYSISYGNQLKVKLMHRRHKGTSEKQESHQFKGYMRTHMSFEKKKKKRSISSEIGNILLGKWWKI